MKRKYSKVRPSFFSLLAHTHLLSQTYDTVQNNVERLHVASSVSEAEPTSLLDSEC